MKDIVADLHLHSKYSRAVSKEMVLPVMEVWARKKGIDVLGTGDWFHAEWMKELEEKLVEVSEGVYELKSDKAKPTNDDWRDVRFLISGEISNIFSRGGRGRRIHTVVMAPNLAIAKQVNRELVKRGCNLSSDGRPIIGLSLIQLSELVWGVDERIMLIPAHAWTPWFGVYGSNGGFESLEEAFGKYVGKIWAVETGMSSDPGMNWGVQELKRRALVSFGDAHSPSKLGREMTIFKLNTKNQILKREQQVQNYTYGDVCGAIGERYTGKNSGRLELAYTVEFYPEEGKYHWDGHRKCGVVQGPEKTMALGTTCPVCGRELTVGVDYRVKQLSSEVVKKVEKVNEVGVKEYHYADDKSRPPYVMMVPLVEIIAGVRGKGVNTKGVQDEYERLVEKFGSELEVLMKRSEDELSEGVEIGVVEAIMRTRRGEVEICPGYDGVFGSVKIGVEGESSFANASEDKQMGLF